MQITKAVKAATNQGVPNDWRYWLPPALAQAAHKSAEVKK